VRLSARNQFKGRIVRIERDGAVSRIWVKVDKPGEIVALITSDAARELDLRRGDRVEAVFKATEVIIAKGGGDGG